MGATILIDSPHVYQSGMTVPLRNRPIAPVIAVNAANHHAQMWMLYELAFQPITQRQKSWARCVPGPSAIISVYSISDFHFEVATIVAPCIASNSVDPSRKKIESMWKGL